MRHILDRLGVLGLVVPLALGGTGCGSESGGHAAPHVVPGGGVGDGPVNGLLNVYVTDEDTRAPVAGASVRVGGSADPAPCTATTDSTGLAIFDGQSCKSLHGKQTLTAGAAGYAPSTWIGVNGTNVTMNIRTTTPAAVETATVSGTIDGWQGLPAPAANHNTLGIVNFSQNRLLGDRANNIAQGTRQVTVPLAGSFPVPANVCVRNALVDDCAWQLTTRTGAQAHYAIVLDQDTKGTANDDTDDTFTVVAWALKTGLDFQAGASAGGEALPMLADADMQPMTVSMAGPPAGLDAVTGFPMLDIGDAGRIPVVSPVLDLTHTMTRIPRLTGALAGAHYDLLAQAQDAKDKPEPSTLAWMHAVDPAATVAVAAWLSPPGGITAAAGSYAFAPVAGATLHGAEIKTLAGDRAWSITIFDGSTSFTLPGLTPDPLPTGMATLTASALQIPGLTLTQVSFDDARERLTGIASDQITFTH